MKIVTILLSVIFIFLFTTTVYAQTSNEVIFQVGNPTDPKPGISCIKSGFVYYSQVDPQWDKGARNMAVSGCGPTSLAMVLSTYGATCNGQTCTPRVVDDIFEANKWRHNGGPSSMTTALVSDWLRNLGFETVELSNGYANLNLDTAQTYLSKDYLIIGSTYSHIVVFDEVRPTQGEVHVRDPLLISNPAGEWRSAEYPWNSSEHIYYSYAIKRVRCS